MPGSAGVGTFNFFSIGSLFLLVGMLLLLEAGFRLGRRRAGLLDEKAREGLSSSEAAVLGLLGLILAFTFGGAEAHREARQQLIADEANAIGTAYLRLDLLPQPDQGALKALFREYLDARLAAYQAFPDFEMVQRGFAEAGRLQDQIWSRATAACRTDTWNPAALLLLPAINNMIDITGTRTMALTIHPPTMVFALLFLLALLSALLAGYAMAASPRRSPLHMVLFAVLTWAVIFVIINLEAPRVSLLRVSASDQMLIDLRQRMK